MVGTTRFELATSPTPTSPGKNLANLDLFISGSESRDESAAMLIAPILHPHLHPRWHPASRGTNGNASQSLKAYTTENLEQTDLQHPRLAP
jgi:hypothetical protein